MVAWISETVLRVLDMLPDRRRDFLRRRIGLTDQEVEKWQDMSTRMFVPFHDEGVISQFEGYGDLEELDWDAYRKQYGNIQRLDRILRAAGDDPDRYKLAKQADALLLFFLFREDELRQILERLGYPYAADTLRKNLDYYDARTSHGSTLSFVAHAGVMASVDPEGSWERYMVALESDVGDVQGGTTAEGIHLGVMSGTLDLIQRFYLGEVIRDGVLFLKPSPVPSLKGLSLPLHFRGGMVQVKLDDGQVHVTAVRDSFTESVKVGVGDVVKDIAPGETHTFQT
jgi:trehalose/maltose hydrolase-like predicted phosphorylase